MEVEGTEQNIILQPEGMIVGAVTSVNGQTGDVVLTTSDLENTSDYQTGEDVQEAIAGKQDKLTAGNNIQISEQNVISATNTTYSAGNGINISGENAISVDTTVVATQQNLSDEVTNRENADIYLQGQIDAISASSDVVDIVGTYAELQAYDTQHLKDNDIIKVLQDETQGNATTYYRWSTHTQTFTLIGQEGPYYTKAGADAQFVPQTRTVNGKALSSNITLDASDVSALGSSDVVQTTGTSTSQVMSQNAVTNELNNKLNVADYVVDTQLADSDNPVQNRVLNGLLGDMPSDFFSGGATTTPTASTEVQFGNILGLDDAQLLGDTYQQTYSGKNLCDLGTQTFTANKYFTIASPLPAGTYTFSAQVASDDTTSTVCYVRFMNGENTSVGNGRIARSADRTSITVTTSGVMDSLYLYAGYDYSGSSGDTATFTDIQIETGSQPTSYEPYTGGIPAPNPDYPQPIQVVTGEQTVTVTGKNLFNKNAIALGKNWNGEIGTTCYPYQTQATRAVILVPVKPNTTYNLSLLESQWYVMQVLEADSSYTILKGNSTQFNQGTKEIVTLANTAYIGVKFKYDSAGTTTIVESLLTELKLQLEQGSATSYEPYQGKSYPISLGSTELCKIGDYQDYIYKSGDDWYVHKETARVDVSSLGGWFASGSYAYKTRNGMSDILPASSDSVTAVGLCNAFSASTTNLVYAGSVDYGFALPGAGGTGILIRNKNVASLADFTTYLSNNPVYGYFALATPTDTKITDATLISELEALLNASTYDGETDFVITATGTNLPAPLQLTAVNANAKGIIYKLQA